MKYKVYFLVHVSLGLGCAQEKKRLGEEKKRLSQPVEVIVERNFVDINIDDLHRKSTDSGANGLNGQAKSGSVQAGEANSVKKPSAWQLGRVPYVVSEDFEHIADLEQAKVALKSLGVQLEPKKSTDVDFVSFKVDKSAGKDCSSSRLSERGGESDFTLAGRSAPIFKNCKISDNIIQAFAQAMAKAVSSKPIENVSSIKAH
jgi:serine protease inhibitor ecotin